MIVVAAEVRVMVLSCLTMFVLATVGTSADEAIGTPAYGFPGKVVRGPFENVQVNVGANGENIAGDSTSPHPQFSLESFAERAPEVIIDVSGSYRAAEPDPDFLERWKALPATPALESQRIHPLTPGLPINPGPRVGELLRFIAERLHPDRFDE